MLKKLYPLIWVGIFFASIFLISENISAEQVQVFISSFGLYAPLVFVLLSLPAFVFAPLSGTPVLFAGYFAFGNKVVFLSTIAALISYIINFWIARRWGRPIVQKLVGKSALHQIDRLSTDYGIVTLALLRIFQGGIHDFVSYAAGLTSMTFRQYIIVSYLAAIPGTLLWYYLSFFIETPFHFTLLTLGMSAIFSTIFILAGFIIKRIKKRH